jgi:hypothetical protein
MGRSRRFVLLVAGGLVACDGTAATEIARGRCDVARFAAGGGNGVEMSATGGGHYLLQNAFDVQFAFSAVAKADGRAMGQFHQKLEVDGVVIDFSGEVTCMAVDQPNHRAWIGGVITENRSTDPAFTGEIFEPGHDVWFRVVDYGEGANATQPDRTTFLGFENNPTIKSSEQYCRERPWPPDDARTWPVTAGNIQVR